MEKILPLPFICRNHVGEWVKSFQSNGTLSINSTNTHQAQWAQYLELVSVVETQGLPAKTLELSRDQREVNDYNTE